MEKDRTLRTQIDSCQRPHPSLFIWQGLGLVAVWAGLTALALALTTGDVSKSALTMLSFGVGTLPAVMGVGIMTKCTHAVIADATLQTGSRPVHDSAGTAGRLPWLTQWL